MIKFFDEIEYKNKIEIYPPFSYEKEEYVLPNTYYINPHGMLYNCFGEDGHKEANLIYTYNLIKDAFYGKKYKSLFDDGNVSLESVLKYELEQYKRIVKTNEVNRNDVMSYMHLDCCNLSDPLVINLVKGIISSKITLLEKFIELKKKSTNLKEDINYIIKESNDDISDILVRYCGFHKIETQVDKTITTTSVDLYSFKNYLSKKYKICVIPKIYSNGFSEFEKVALDRFIDKNPEYEAKIRIYK